MAAWAYECRPAHRSGEYWLVGCLTVDEMPGKPRIVRVKVGSEWLCAVVDRTRRIEADRMLLREVIASDEADCPECAERPPAATDTEPGQERVTSSRQVQAAAILLRDHRFVVVLVGLDLVNRPGEADMAIADLSPHFADVDVVLMGQREDGTPQYHGKAALVEILSGLPIERMPWKTYPVG